MAEYHNPQNESGLDVKRMLIVFAATFLMIAAFQQFMVKKPETAPVDQNQQRSQPQGSPAQSPAGAGAAIAAPKATEQAAPIKKAESENETVVENDLYKITFTNKGAQVKSWVLKKYKDNNGKPLDMVNHLAAPVFGAPLSLWTWDDALRNKLNTALYAGDGSGPLHAPATLTFDYADGDLVVHKSFSFDETYEVKVETSVVRGGFYVTAMPAWPAGFGDATLPANYTTQQLDHAYGDDLTRLSPDPKGKKLAGGNLLYGPFSYVGVCDQYFAAIFMPDRPVNASVITLQNPLEVPKDPANLGKDIAALDKDNKVKVDVLGAAVGTPGAANRSRLYVGPKDIDVLATIHPNDAVGVVNRSADLRPVVDFGRFAFFARPLFTALRWIEKSWIHNWGWAIVILTLGINIILLPLRVMSMRSALKMQRIAPQIKQIQDKYKNLKMTDPRRAEQQKEINELQEKHGVNPLGGCLPLLIQMPFLWAFYTMLGSAIELRQAQWFWLKDLSSPDPYFLIPILIVVTMILMQRMTPAAGVSAEQQRMMNVMMPVMIGAFSWRLPSGLGLYWATGTVVGIVQQMGMNQTSLGKEMRALAVKRASKAKK